MATNTAQNIQGALTAGTEAATQISSFLNPYALGGFRNQNTSLSADNIGSLAASVVVTGSGVDIEAVNNLIDCARNLEDRLLLKLQEKLLELLLANPQAASILAIASAAAAFVSSITQLIEIVKKVDVQDLVSSLIIARGLSGLARAEKINEILKTFGDSVNNLTELIEKLDVLDVCSVPNVRANGLSMSYSNIPSGAPPLPIPVGPSANINSPMNDIKEEYDSLMLEIKEHTGKDPDKTSKVGYDNMITSVNTVVMAYHDKVLRSNSTTDDPGLYDQYKKSVILESNIHSQGWDDETKKDYNARCENAGRLISENTTIIRNFYLRSNPGPVVGALISTGITWYSGPQRDFTTYLDLKTSERPPELTAYWKSKGYNTDRPSGTLNFSDTVTGALGDPLIPDFSCASTRVPVDSVLAFKNQDGTPYDPTGKNPQGLYRVLDTGNAALTYKKPDVYTLTPELYKNMDRVQVYLVSSGRRYPPQYKRAQRLFGSTVSV